MPPGRRAHQMPDFIVNSTSKLTSILENLYLFFGDELLQCTEFMTDSEIKILVHKFEKGIQKGLQLHQK